MGNVIILEEESNHDITVKRNSENIGFVYLSRVGAVYRDKEGVPLIILEKLGDTFIVKVSGGTIGSVYPRNGSYEYKDNDGNVFALEESEANEFTFKKSGESNSSIIKICVHPFEGISGIKSHLDSNYY